MVTGNSRQNSKKQRVSTLLFSVLLMSTSAFVAVAVTHTPVPDWANKLNAPFLPLFTFTVFLTLLCVSFSLGNPQNPLDVAKNALLLSMPGLSVALSVVSLRWPLPPMFFWVMLLIWTIMAVIVLAEEATGWRMFLLLLAVVWTVSGLICLLGEITFYPYAREPLARLRFVHILLDVRVLTSFAFVMSFLVTAAHRAFNVRRPEIRDFVLPQLPSPWGKVPQIVAAVLAPIALIFNFLVRMLSAVLNFLWTLAAVFGIYIYFTSREIRRLVLEVFSKVAVIKLLRICGAFTLCLFLVVLADRIADPATYYLLSNGWSEGLDRLGIVAAFGAVMFFAAVLLALVISPKKVVASNASFGLSYILCIILLAGVSLYLLRWRDLLPIVGFSRPGPFTMIFVGFFTLCLLYVSVRKVPADREDEDGETGDTYPGWSHGIEPRVIKASQLGALLIGVLLLGWWLFEQIEHLSRAGGRSTATKLLADPLPPEALPTPGNRPSLATTRPRLESPPANQHVPDVFIKPQVENGNTSDFLEKRKSAHSDRVSSESAKASVTRIPNGGKVLRPSKEALDEGRQQPRTVTRRLSLETNPEYASVYIDGTAINRGDRLSIPLSEGQHWLEVASPGFRVTRKLIDIRAGLDQSLRIVLEPLDPPRPDPQSISSVTQEPLSADVKSSPRWLTNRRLARSVRGLSVMVYCNEAGCERAKILQSRLKQLGGKATLQVIALHRSKGKASGVFFAEDRLDAARGVKMVAQDLCELKLFLREKKQEDISVYLLD